MLKHAQRTRRLRGLPRPDFRRSRFLSQSWPARINEIPRASTSHEELAAASKRLSCLSDTSSAFSGSDNMASSQSLLDAEDLDLSDLVESSVDSDGDDLTSSFESLTFQDTLKDCLEKDPSERTEKDVEMLMEFTKQLDAFAKMTLAVQRAICSVMVFAVVESAGTDLMREGDEIDSWCVIVNGSVEVVHPGGATEKLHVGNCFGARASLEKLSHRGVMRTCCDDCQFVCVPQSDFFCILHQGEENIRRHEEGGRVVLVTEPQGDHQVVTRGTPEKLIKQLVEDKPAYIEDFLLTHRTFIDDPLQVTNQLQKWFSEPSIRDRVARVVLLWVRNHLNDFEANPEMMAFLETFVCWLEQEGLKGELGMLTTLLEASSRSRTLVLARSCRDETLQISVKGGCDQGFGIFISQVDKHSKAEQAGFLRGDQILEVNGQNFELSPVTHDQALKILRDSTHLSITVRSNIMVFRELLQTADASRRRGGRTSATGATTAAVVTTTASLPARVWRRDKEGRRARLQRVLAQLGQPLLGILTEPFIINASLIESSLGSKLFNGHTTAALPSNQSADVSRNTYTMHSLKVYKSDQTFRYLLVHAETTALEVVRAALREFGMAEEGTGFFLCEVSVAESGLTKQSRLPDHLTNLAERISLNSRYVYHAHGVIKQSRLPDHLNNLAERISLNSRYVYHAHGVIKQSRLPDHLTNLAERISLNSRYVYHAHGVIKQSRLPDHLTNLAERISLNSRYVYHAHGVIKQSRLPDHLNNLAERISLNSRYVYHAHGVIKQSRLPDHLTNLAERISLNSRYVYHAHGVIKQSRLPDHLTNLAERISLNSRYVYHAHGLIKQSRLPDHLANLAERISLNSRYVYHAHGVIKQSRLPDHLTNLAERISLNSRYVYHARGVIKQSRLPDHLANLAERISLNSRYVYHAHGVIKQSRLPDHLTNLAERIFLNSRYVYHAHGVTKQSRLPDHLTNLAERISLNSRYYLKAYGSTEPLVPDELVPELARDSRTHFLQLNCAQVAVQLTLDDFSVFRQIQSTEYVDHVFGRNSRYGTPMLARFAELANREMFWVITEICSEMNVVRRSKIIKQFIKLARECKACNNFNSMFAILAGLGYRSVSRLKLSWERLPVKYQRLFSDLEDLMDTSRNMSKYRQLVASKMSKGPIIPFYPLVTKDLTFICEGNETYVDGLINFEKLRKFASVVRTLNNMCSSPYDLFTFLEQGGQTSHAAMRSLNLNLTSGTCQPSEDLATIKRRKTSPAMLNPKKMFEEAQMVRRVKEYLNNMPVITDEEKLYVMSLMCEPPLRKRHPSPPPPRGGSAGGGRTSPAGSSSSTGMKRSLSARKLQSLSEPIRSRGPGARRKGSSPASPVSTPAQPAADRRGKTASDTVLEHVQT
ncbi:rap guanine nucleotide exchange factor 2-like isoform X2 [Bacillus rossius redtenbacheri]|uniref:rap guanine nucleotide exchange factor 2-like isoform X2 n=1 Tax=Bacillus rossius redtenbacheri TaxID=93214 RepID=UPI002FDD4858